MIEMKSMNRAGPSPVKRSQIGPNIVRAWFDSVMNPLLRALNSERELLREHHWTWRFQPPGLEMIRPVRAYLEPGARENLQHFTILNPPAKGAIDEHDKKVAALLARCEKFHRALVAHPDLGNLYRKTTSTDSLAALGLSDVSDVFGEYPEKDHLDLLAQYIVNNTQELPPYYTVSRLWNRYRDEFLAIRNRAAVGGHYHATDNLGAALLRQSEQLIRFLETRRLQLSLEHDQPYVSRA